MTVATEFCQLFISLDFVVQNNSQLHLLFSYRPYSPAIPRIPCVSPETVLLDQVGLTHDV